MALVEPLLKNMQFDSLHPKRLKYVVLTHAHCDHTGASSEWKRCFDVEGAASRETAEYLSKGYEERVSTLEASKNLRGKR